MAQRIGKAGKTLTGVKSEKVFERDTQCQTRVDPKTIKEGYCQCVCKKCGHTKHERQEKLLRDKLTVQGRTAVETAHEQRSGTKTNVRSPKTHTEEEHRTTQVRATSPQNTRVKSGGPCSCCGTGVCLNYKACPNTSPYMESEALRMRLQEQEFQEREAQRRRQDFRAEEADQVKEHPISGPKCQNSWYNDYKEQQFNTLNNRVGSYYHGLRKQLQLASDPYDFVSGFQADGAHCPYRLPNHRNYQWENKVVPERYNCPMGAGCRIYCGINRSNKCCVQQQGCCKQ